MDTRYLEYGVFVPKDGAAPEKKKSDANATAFSWGRVGAKWVKIGPDGKPMDPPPKPPQPPSSGDSNDSASNSICCSDDKRTNGIAGAGAASGSRSYMTPRGSWDTPPLTSSDSCEDNERETAENGDVGAGDFSPSGDSGARGGAFGSNRSSVDFTSAAAGNSRLDADDGGDGESMTGGARLSDGKSSGVFNSKGGGNFFGEDIDGFSSSGAKGNIARGLGASGGEERVDAASGGYGGEESGDAACVGERSEPSSERKKGKLKRSGSGSSNTANSPRKDKDADKISVETRDVACQWDGSEMGDGSDDSDEEIPQVELPDTPDCNALTAVLRLYDHARLENKRTGVASSRPGWGVEENIEKWDGVYLDIDDRIVALDVDGDPENRQTVLIGPLPVELASMDHLEQLTMRGHRFKGRIPAELGKLNRLTHLNLSNCRLIGSIPTEFRELVNLVVLNLSWNFLNGELPPELARLAQLEELLLNSNAFSGAIPPEYGKLKKLQRFNVGHSNGISGTLPPELCRLSQLVLLDLRKNKITGKIPPVFGRLTNLQQLLLQDNQLTDDIPAELARLPRLQMLHLANNKLSGVIPKALRGHPRYRVFKILPGNVALGERVAPNTKQIEAAARRMPSTSAMTHASAAHAQAQAQAKAQQQQGALRRDSASTSMSKSMSLSPPLEGVDGPGARRSTVGGDASSTASGATEDDGSKRRSSTSRGGVGRRLRDMKRIMGKKITPPQSPNSMGYTDGQPREQSLSPVGRVLTPGAGFNFSSPRTDDGEQLTVTSPSAGVTSSSKVMAVGKAFLEGDDDAEEAGASRAAANGNESPNATESLSTVNGASPSSNERDDQARVLG